ncbi:MAG: transglutaminase-like domain-containing protein [Sulfobacillus thermotolerans]|nr:transglutaminase-like domain-containing protein [Sulfobacillus thermotolerans]
MGVKRFVTISLVVMFSGVFTWTPGVFAAQTNLSIASPDAIPTLPAHYTFSQTITLTNTQNAEAYDVKADVVLLAPETSYSQVQLIHTSIQPVSTYHDQYGNLIGSFMWNQIAPHQTVTLVLDYTATSSEVSYKLPVTYPPYNTHSSVYQTYTNPAEEAQEVDTDSPVLENIVNSVITPGENPEQKAHALFEWIVANIHYNYTLQASGSAVATAESHLGICSDIADLYVGLLRTAKIPARFVGGYVTSNGSGQGGFHQWTEFYLPTVGWVVADPTWGAYGYFASLQDHWHIALYDGIRKDITVNWNYSPSALTAAEASSQIAINYHYVFAQTPIPTIGAHPKVTITHRVTKPRPLLDPSTISHRVHSVPLKPWQAWWLAISQWIRQTEDRVGAWISARLAQVGL